jgi:protocatechuate 3,4-dioxygenase beta subunit
MTTMFFVILATLLVDGQAAAPGGVIAGRVVEQGTNQPIADARVQLAPQRRGAASFGPPRETISDQQGRYAFGGVEPGSYRVLVQKAGYAGPDQLSLPISVTIAAGQTISNADQFLQPGAVISGRVLDERGQPVADARVSALRQLPGGAARVRLLPDGQSVPTNDLGEFRVHSLPAGEYYVQAAPRPDSPFGNAPSRPTTMAATFYPSTTDAAASYPITVATGQTVGDILITMLVVPAYEISGVVVDESGVPVADAMIMLQHDPAAGVVPMRPPGRARTDAAGQFVIPNVTSGAYLISAAAPLVSASPSGGGGGTVSTASNGGVVGGVAGAATSWSTMETRGGATIQYRADASSQLRVTVNDASITGLQLTARRPR